MNLFFSHFPARVEASASGICRAKASMSEIACSAVVIELPNGVFMTMMPRDVAAGMSTLSTPMPARPMTFRCLACSRIFAVTLVAERMARPSKFRDRGCELFLVLAQRGLEIHVDAAILEDLHGRRRERIGNENFGHGWPHAALVSEALASANAQSSQGVSAWISLRSTVAPHQMRRPGGASR